MDPSLSDHLTKPRKIAKPKRKANPEGWQKIIAKRNRAMGKEYKNTKGVIVPEKTFKDDQCGCKRKCNSKISSADREENFRQFYALANQALQNLFIRGQVHIADVKKRCPKDESRGPKGQTFLYYIRVKKSGIRVCKKYFEDTFQIGSKRIRDCTLKDNIIDVISEKRGQRNPKNKIDTTEIEQHLKSYQNLTDASTNRLTLPPELTIKKIYQTYVAKCQSEGKVPVKEKFFYCVVKRKFDVKFSKTKKEEAPVIRSDPVTTSTNDSTKDKVYYIGVDTIESPSKTAYLYQTEVVPKYIQIETTDDFQFCK